MRYKREAQSREDIIKKTSSGASALIPIFLLASSLTHALTPAVPVMRWAQVMCFANQQSELTKQQKDLLLELATTTESLTGAKRWRAVVGAEVAREEGLRRGREMAEVVAEHLERTHRFNVRTGSGWNPLAVHSWVRTSPPIGSPRPSVPCQQQDDAVEVSVEVYAVRAE